MTQPIVILKIARHVLGWPRRALGFEMLDDETPRNERWAPRRAVGHPSGVRASDLPHDRPHSLGGKSDETLEEVAETDRRRRRDVDGVYKIDPRGGPGQRGHGGHAGDEGAEAAQPEYLAPREIVPRVPESSSRDAIPAFDRSTRWEQAARKQATSARHAAPGTLWITVPGFMSDACRTPRHPGSAMRRRRRSDDIASSCATDGSQSWRR